MSSDDDLPLPRKVDSSPRARPPLKKRPHGASYVSAQSNSSDGPFFSSDDLEDASAENYASPRRKKQFKRTWWQPESPTGSRNYDQAKQERRLPKDSGVFMSDASSNEDGFSVEPLSSPPRRSSRHDPRFSVFKASSNSVRRRDDPEARAYDLIAGTIDDSLKAGSETVDLSSCALTTVPNDLLLRLRHLIRVPRLVHDKPDEESYQSLVPSIKLYLASNSLRQYPGAISALENISVLSLRNNKISELPSSVGKLSNLVELNLAGNRLRWLPFELLDVFCNQRIPTITYEPNPLLKIAGFHDFTPTQDIGSTIPMLSNLNPWLIGQCRRIMSEVETAEMYQNESLATTRTLLKKWYATEFVLQSVMNSEQLGFTMIRESPDNIDLIMPESFEGPEEMWDTISDIYYRRTLCIGHTSIAYLELDGRTPARSSPPPPSSLGIEVNSLSLASKPSQPPANFSTNTTLRVPSLFELSSRACIEAAPLSDLLALLPEDLPNSMRLALEQANRVRESGGMQCSACQCEYVIPRAEWLEFWHVSNELPRKHFVRDDVVPFLRQACSWACAKPTAVITHHLPRSVLRADADLVFFG